MKEIRFIGEGRLGGKVREYFWGRKDKIHEPKFGEKR